MAARNTPAWRWLALVMLGILALPLYVRILAVAGQFATAADSFTLPESGALVVAIVAAALILLSRPANTRRRRWIELALLLGFGAAFRAIFFTTTPAISHDAYRYVWDAHLLANGVSPWVHALSDPALKPLRDSAIWPLVNWRNSPTIYPPGAQLFFLLVNAIAPLNIAAMKWAMTLCDFGIGALTFVLLRQRGQDLRRVIIYWWNPLPIVEFTFNAHVDAVATLWTLAALALLARDTRRARGVSGVLLGLAATTKLYPLLFAVAFLRPATPISSSTDVDTAASLGAPPAALSSSSSTSSDAGQFLVGRTRGQGVRSIRRQLTDPLLLALGATIVLVYLPFAFVGLGNGGFLATYFGQRFPDQGILFRLLTAVFVVTPLQLALQGIALVALCGFVAWLRLARGLEPAAGVLAISAIWIVLSPHLFPWYVAGLLPLLALYLQPISLHRLYPLYSLYRRRLASPFLHRSPPKGVAALPATLTATTVGAQQAAPAGTRNTIYPLALYLFALAMPFTYVIFAPGHNSNLFVWFFYVPLALAATPWLTRVIATLRRHASRQPMREEGAHPFTRTQTSASAAVGASGGHPLAPAHPQPVQEEHL